MKKYYILLLLILTMSCSKSFKTRHFNGTIDIKLEFNHIVKSISWKSDNLWIHTVDTTTNVTYFSEYSSDGLIYGTIILH